MKPARLALLAVVLPAFLLTGCGLSRGKAERLLMERDRGEVKEVLALLGSVSGSEYYYHGYQGRPSWMSDLKDAGLISLHQPVRFRGGMKYPYRPSEQLKSDFTVGSVEIFGDSGPRVVVCTEETASVAVTGLREQDGTARVEYDRFVKTVRTGYADAAPGLIPDGGCRSRKEAHTATFDKYDDGWRLQ